MGPGVSGAVDILASVRGNAGVGIDWGPGFDRRIFYHTVTAGADENYLSVVTFVHCGGIRMVFPGDLTEQGWRDFVGDPLFMAYLRTSNIFVASHHGREDGYCPEIFEGYVPEIVIISDKSVMYDTQLVNYGQRARGIRWNETETRSCLTTRNDGKLTITPTPSGGYFVTAGA